ncbi:MAG: amidohydrolase family protein [Gemmatimonadaceae bacterium]
MRHLQLSPVVRATAAVVLLVASTSVARAQTIAITGGRVFPVSGEPIDNATVLIRDGRIAAVGVDVTVPDGARRIDATGKWVTPGIINGATALGLVEIGAVGDTRDFASPGEDLIAAALTVWEALNPASVLLAPARNEGITSVVVLPAGGLISGQAAFVDLMEGPVPDMVVRGPVAMVGEIGDKDAAGVNSRAAVLVRLRELLEDTRAYSRNRAAFERGDTREYAVSRLDLEAMIPVLEGDLPLLFAVEKASDIQSALRIADEYDLDIMIGGGAEGWMVADEIAAAGVPVLTGAMSNIPSSFSTLGSRQENAALLRAAGVEVILIGNAGEAFNVRNVKQEAGNAVAYGLPWDAALRAVTLAPAEAFGVGDDYGSLEAGKVANVVVWSGDPFEFTTEAEHVIVRGEEISEMSRQQMLMRRYRELPPAYFETP